MEVSSQIWKRSMGLISLHRTDQILTVHFSRDSFLRELNDITIDVDKVYIFLLDGDLDMSSKNFNWVYYSVLQGP